MSNAEKRHIFAPTYGDENRIGRYALIEIYPNVVAIALAAQKHAVAFDADTVTEGYYSNSQVTTPELGGECIYESLPDELEDMLIDCDFGDDPYLLPTEWDPLIAEIKAKYTERDALRWDCRPLRFVADKDDIRAQIADKHQPDNYVWTSDLLPLLSALKADFDVAGFACD